MNASRCLAPTCADGPPPLDGDTDARPRLTEDPWNLCARCFQRLEHNLADLPALDDAVRALVPHGLSPGLRLGNKATKGGPPLPVRGLDTLLDHLTDTQAVLVSWVQLVCEETSLHGPAVSDSATLARWLLARLDWLAQHPAAGDLTDEVGKLHRTGTALTQSRANYHRKPGPCPMCESSTLGRWDGDGDVTCESCGTHVTIDQYQALVTEQARNSDALLDRAEVSLLLGITRPHLRVLLKRGLLRPSGTVDGQDRYLAADVEAYRTRREAAAS